MNFLSNIPIILPLTLIPTLGWIVVYRYLDSREPEPLSTSAFALILGMLATFPVFLIQFFFSQFPDYSLVSIVGKNVSNPIILTIIFLFFVGFIEEFVKAIAFIIVVEKRERDFNQIVDGIVYGALIGIGFGITENIYYFFKALEAFDYSTGFWAVFFIRSFGTMLAHTLFTGTFGFFFAKAYFFPFIDEQTRPEKLWHNLRKNLKQAIRLHTTCLHLLPGWKREIGNLSRNAIIFEGYFIAVFLHFLYNALIKIELFGKSWTALIIPLIFLLAWFLWSRFFIRLYTRILDFIRVKKDLYKLKIH